MNVQRELWAAPNEAKILRMSVERLWTKGEGCYSLSVAATGTKTSEAVWISTQDLAGPHALSVASAIIEADLARFGGTLWSHCPPQQHQDKWERHLYTF